MTIIPRDQSLDSELESGAHLTLILVAIGLAFLFTATAVIFYLFPVCRIVRRTLSSRQPATSGNKSDSDSGQPQNSANGKEIIRPKMTSRQVGHAQTLNRPCQRPELTTVPTQRSPPFFVASIPRHPNPPPVSYNTPTAGSINPPISSLNRSHTTRYSRPLPPPPLPTAQFKLVSPDITGWMMRIADDVVGRHPFAIPLFERVATRAEIALISGHVYIPWAHEGRRSHPEPATALGPGHVPLERFSLVSWRGARPQDTFPEMKILTSSDNTFRHP